MAKSKSNKKAGKGFPQKILRSEISATHYKRVTFESDKFYTDLANRIYPIIFNAIKDMDDIPTVATARRIAITLSCYVEDLVSDSGIWAAFTSLHKKKYGSTMPFYNVDKPKGFKIFPYSEDRPCLQVIQFLLWYCLNGLRKDIIINPQNEGLLMIALAVLPELDEAYEEAPDSPCRPIIVDEKQLGIPVFFQIRNICEWLCTGCYLTRVNDMNKLNKDFEVFVDGLMSNDMLRSGKSEKQYMVETFAPLNALIGPLALTPQEWLTEIISVRPEEEEEQYLPLLREMKSRPYQIYKYKEVGKTRAILLSQAGEELEVSALTLPGETFAGIEEGTSTIMSLVYFDGVWVMNGFGIQQLPGKVYDETHEKYMEYLEKSADLYEKTLKILKRKRIGVCANYNEYASNIFKTDEWKKHLSPEMDEDLNDVDNLLYFLNTDGTVTMLPDWGSVVKLRGNKYYDKEEAAREGVSLIFDHDLSTPELREYLIDHKLLSDAALNSAISEKAGRDLFQKNIRFFNDYTNRDSMIYLLPHSLG